MRWVWTPFLELSDQNWPPGGRSGVMASATSVVGTTCKVEGDTVTISVSYGPLDATFTGLA
jgi:hypothetical protein